VFLFLYPHEKMMMVSKKSFGFIDGEEVFLFQLSNGEMDVAITNYGASVVSIFTPDRDGVKRNIVAGFRHASGYGQDHPYFGCIVGRFANRIAKGRFTLDGREWQLPLNDGVNHLHGGNVGFNRKHWKIEETVEEEKQCGVRFSYHSADGEEGYPGNLDVSVFYILTADNRLTITYSAVTDQPTIISLTNHSYFNLSGFEQETIHEHYLQIHADRYTVKNENNTPSGEIATVTNTPFDFSSPRRLGQYIFELETDMGYDHNFVLNNDQQTPARAAALYDPASGRVLEVFTNMPGMQVYTSNWWDGALTGYQGKHYQKHGAVALETQAFPDAPNQPNFPSAVLRPGETYSKETTFRFFTQ
jgi:aldose 1-epimerase